MAASIEAKHAYRFGYLKSEHWANLRLSKLASVDARCQRCPTRDLSNDVHHLRYRNLYDVTEDDLLVLCRKCHDAIHISLDAAREAMEEGGTRSLEAWRIFLAAWGDKPHLVRELWSVIRDMRKAGKVPRGKERSKLKLLRCPGM